MTTLQELSNEIEKLLNDEIKNYGLDKVHDNMIYKFSVRATSKVLAESTDEKGVLTKYINVLLLADGGTNSGINKDTYKATQPFEVTIIVPDAEDEFIFNEKKLRLEDAVIALLNETLAFPISKNVGEYYTTFAFGRTADGVLMMREKVGVAMTLSIPATLLLVYNGYGSKDYYIEIKDTDGIYKEIYPTSMTVYRSTSGDGQINAKSGDSTADGVSRLLPTSTQLTIGIAKPLQKTLIDSAIMDYTLNGENTTLEIKLGLRGTEYYKYYKMILAEATTAREEDFAISANCKLVEKFEV